MLYPHKRGRYQQEAKALFESLVPDLGQADTVQGELVRCSVRLGSESYRNGNCNWDLGFKMMARFLAQQRLPILDHRLTHQRRGISR